MALRYSPVPVVVAPAGLALGGGCEIRAARRPRAGGGETYIGLVEVGVGLIPAGGGTKEMLARAMAQRADAAEPIRCRSCSRRSRPSRSRRSRPAAPTRVRLGYLAPTDAFTMNRERLMADAKAMALERVREGYHAAAAATGDSGRRRVARPRR